MNNEKGNKGRQGETGQFVDLKDVLLKDLESISGLQPTLYSLSCFKWAAYGFSFKE